MFTVLAWQRFPAAPYIIDILAVMSSLYALYDLSDFLLVGARTDAVVLAQLTHIPAFIWAILWSIVALLVVYTAANRPSPGRNSPRLALLHTAHRLWHLYHMRHASAAGGMEKPGRSPAKLAGVISRTRYLGLLTWCNLVH